MKNLNHSLKIFTNNKINFNKAFNKINQTNYLKNFYFSQNKNIHVNIHNNFVEPSDEEEPLEDVKNWLNKEQPKYLSVFFTNNWNPVAVEANKNFIPEFAVKSGSFRNLIVDVDKFSRLKWYFDSRCEPGFHFYYYGSLITKKGGCNFSKNLLETQRIREYIDSNDELQEYHKGNITYEQPYFDFEAQLEHTGMRPTADKYQHFIYNFWANQSFYKQVLFEDNFCHKRLKK